MKTPEFPSTNSIALDDTAKLNSVEISSPARIHFGLLSVGQDLPVNFGGAGLMIAAPRTIVRVAAASRFSVSGADPFWLQRIVRRWQAAFMPQLADEFPAVEIEVLSSLPRHFGFGSGTQMALSVGAAMCKLFSMGNPGPQELARGLGRANRSAIGTYGFFRGGFLIDRGLDSSDSVSPLELRLDFPESWRIVLIQPEVAPGNHGKSELDAFDYQVRVCANARSAMTMMLREKIVPALIDADYDTFANAIHEFNIASGKYYESVQGGLFHSPPVEELVLVVRRMGIPGVIQSSWGPTLVAITPDNQSASELVCQLVSKSGNGHPRFSVTVTTADNCGAVLKFD